MIDIVVNSVLSLISFLMQKKLFGLVMRLSDLKSVSLTSIIGTNTRKSRYGDPKVKRISVMVIANCVALENEIFHEHVLYNTSAMLQQLDIDLWDEAERLIKDQWQSNGVIKVWLDLRNSHLSSKSLFTCLSHAKILILISLPAIFTIIFGMVI